MLLKKIQTAYFMHSLSKLASFSVCEETVAKCLIPVSELDCLQAYMPQYLLPPPALLIRYSRRAQKIRFMVWSYVFTLCGVQSLYPEDFLKTSTTHTQSWDIEKNSPHTVFPFKLKYWPLCYSSGFMKQQEQHQNKAETWAVDRGKDWGSGRGFSKLSVLPEQRG